MIDLNELVFALNEYLGRDKFVLFLGTNGAPDKDEERVVGTVNVGRVPYAFSTDQIDAESLNITFTFDLPCGTVADDSKRDLAVATIGEKLIGWRKIRLDYVDGSTYYLNTFFEALPMGQPYVDCGRITQQLVVSGKALIQHGDCGAWLGNNERITLTTEGGNGIKGEVLVVDKASSTTISHDPAIDLSAGSYIPAIEAIAYTNTVKLTCLYMGTRIDKFFWKVGEGLVGDPNEHILFESERITASGDMEYGSEKMCKIVSVSNISSAGVFNRYEVVLQMLYEV
jgi:hypothetical protein